VVQSEVSSEIYSGNNSTTSPYPIGFYFFHDEDLVVTSIDTLGTKDILQLNTDYIVTGAGDPNGGSLKTNFALPNNWKILIERVVEPTQLTSYQEGDSFPAKSHENALDKLTMLCQQNARAAGSGGAGGGGGGRAWADEAERQLTTPNFIGQLGFQVNTATIYYAQSMTTGDWKIAIFDNLSSEEGQVAVFTTDAHLTTQAMDGIATLIGGVLGAIAKPAGELVGTTQPQTLTNKTLESPVINTPTGLHPVDVGLGNVDNVSDANKPISNQTAVALAEKEDKINKDQNGGYAGLDATGKIPLQQLPQSVLGANVYQGTWNAATNTPTIPPANLANQGWYWVVNVAGSTNIDGISTWAAGDWIISNGTTWERIINIDSVSSVNAMTGAVVVTKSHVGLSAVDNTSDATKNSAAVTLTNKTLAAPVINNPTGLVKADVGLSQVDNTSDAQKNAAAVTLTNKTIDGANNTLRVRLDTTDVVNNLPVSHLNGGAAAGPTTFWRGDGQWITPPGTGDVTGPAGAIAGEFATYANTTGKLLARNAPPMLVGDTQQGVNPSYSIIVPRYANHPDRIIASPSAFDDHFDGTTLNAKWVVTDNSSGSISHTVAGSHLNLYGTSPNGSDNINYAKYLTQALPNANNFTLTLKLETTLIPNNSTGSTCNLQISVYGGGGSPAGVQFYITHNFTTGVGVITNFHVYVGSGFNTAYWFGFCVPPKYLQFVFMSSTGNIELHVSNDGHAFVRWVTVPPAYTNFAPGASPPTHFELGYGNQNVATGIVHIDWIKFTNP
jgi:hypothetical protein